MTHKYEHVVLENTFGEHLVCSVFGHSFTSEMDSEGADVIVEGLIRTIARKQRYATWVETY